VLSALPATRRYAHEGFILDLLNRYFPDPLSLEEFRTGLEWNHARGYIEFRKNEDEERVEWALTESGRQKEGL
jgi:hypothetical protein